MRNVKYPPEKIYSPSKWKRPNYDHIILWMLNNNEMCKWADFCKEPIEIPPGTLSRHLEPLKRKGFVEKVARGHYRITPEGKKEFHALSGTKKKAHQLNYPPEVIIKSGRNYFHWILWMVYNNTYCKRSEFLEDPLSINQSSLSKNLNSLIEKGFVIKEDGKYVITRAGKSEYSKMLQNYDLDRQTILEEESKRVDETTKKTFEFFSKFKVTNDNIRYRFINNKLKLDYSKVSNILKEEVDFDKVLLFISTNHPDFYPDYISFDEFSRFYHIKKKTLDFWVDEIVENDLFNLKFFKLEVFPDKCYYFRSNDKLERILRAITEDHITKYTFLAKFGKSETMTSIIDDILEEICSKIFNEDLRDQLKDFLPEYIRVLAYKIETKGMLKDTYDKLEGLIWQNMSDIIQIKGSNKLENQYKEKIKEIDNELESDPMNLDLYYSKIRILVYFNQYNLSLTLLDEILENFPENEKDIKIKKASVLKKMKRVESGLELINDLIQKYPKDHDLLSYKAYWLQFLDRKEEAIKVIQKLIENEPDKGIYYDTYGEILMYFEEYEEATKKFVKAMVLGSHDWYIYQTYIKLGICYKVLGNLEFGTENLKKGRSFVIKSVNDPDTKKKWLSIVDLFLSDNGPIEVKL
ncbi:MAG: hypothetical protein HWN79_14845 [Candidatus Lokiarchaeota archaeon]|nr:hypothetical protein [Candidatus Lokiarchaeota archaeon]